MAPSSSIFSSEPVSALVNSLRERFSSRDRQTLVWGLVFALPALAVSLLSPIEVISPQFLKTNPVRVVHNPVTAPKPGFCEVTEDGLVYYPTEMKAESTILLIGNSHSDWHMFPQWIEREGRIQGHRIAVLSAARPACSAIEMLDTLIYLLKTNSRHFDAILVKPGNPFFDDIAHPFERESTDPAIGTGFSVIHTGMPLAGTPFTWKEHLRLTLLKRKTDLNLIERTHRMRQMHDQTLPSGDVELVTSVPQEVQEVMDREGERYEQVLTEMNQVCKGMGIPLILMTTPGRLFDLSDPAVLAMKSTTPAFFNRYSLLGINQQLTTQFNTRVRNTVSQEGCALIDSEALVKTLPPNQNHYQDFVHLNPAAEQAHGRFVYQRLREMGW